MALRARKPIVKQARLKTLLYADKGVGKTHFCCSFPNTYYIDTEGLQDFPHFVKMIVDNGGDLLYLTELTEIISEVKELLTAKHNYKTLVIDSISFPAFWLSQMEAERLAAKTKDAEGTEYGANLAKAKRFTFQLGILLSRLDMNVIVVAHEKRKYADNKEVGKEYDVNEKMAYALGAVWNLRLLGKTRKLFIEKSRYAEMPTGEIIDFENGYDVVKDKFGEEIFKRQSKAEELATSEQIEEFNRAIKFLQVPDTTIQKWLQSVHAAEVSEVNRDILAQKINDLHKKLKGKGEAA